MDHRDYFQYSLNVFKNEQANIFSTLDFLNNSDKILNRNVNKSNEIKDILKQELEIKDIPKIKTIEVNREFVFIIPNQIKIKEINQIEKIDVDPVNESHNSVKEINYPKFAFLTDPYLQEEKTSPDLDLFELNLDFTFLENIKQEYSNEQLINMLNYKHNRLFDVINTFDNLVNNHKDKKQILKELSYNVLKSKLSGKKLNHWIENFPIMIDNKIRAIRNKTKPKNPNRVKAGKKSFKKGSELKLLTAIRMLEAREYYNVNIDSVRANLHLELDEIVETIIEEIKSEINDHDMIEYDENKQFQDHIKMMKEKYKEDERFEQ